jgi:hypothetical protein
MSFQGHQAGPIGDDPSALGAQLDPLDFSAPRPKKAASKGDDELHVCASCGSDLVQPIDWAPADNLNWTVRLRCPECESVGHGIHSQQVVDRFDVELDRGTDMLIEDLSRLTRANMEDEAERFIAALTGDHILAEDF